MKKLLLSLLAVVGLSTAASAQSEPAFTLQFGKDYNSKGVTSYTSSFTVSNNNVTFDIAGFNNSNNAWNDARCGRSNNASTATITNQTAISQAIEKVVINAYKAYTAANNIATSAELLVADNIAFTNAESFNITSSVNALTSSSEDITINIPEARENMYYRIKIVMPNTNSKNGWLAISNIKMYAQEITKEPAGLSFDETSFTIKDNESFTAPTLNNPNKLPVTWDSSDKAVATVANNGAVTIVAAGTTTITATSAATDIFEVGKAEYTLTVEPSVILNNPELSFSEETAEAKLGKAFTTPTFNNPHNLPVTWDSSDKAVATVNEEGDVTIVAAGTTTISAKSAKNNEYAAGEAYYTLTVIDPTAPVTVSFDFVNNDYNLGERGDNNYYIPSGTSVIYSNIKLTIFGKDGARLWSDGLRCYKTLTLELSAPDDCVITSVKFGQNYSSFDYNGVPLTGAEWTGSENTVKFTSNFLSGNKPINTLTVTYKSNLTGNQKPAELSFGNITESTAYFGEPFTAPKLENPNNLPVTWDSSDKAVATVNEEGAVTILAVGTTTISASSAATDDYAAGKAEYTLTVIKKCTGFAEIAGLADGTEVLISGPLTAVYQNGSNLYMVDAEGGAMLIFGDCGVTDIVNGNVFASLDATVNTYGGEKQLVPLKLGERSNGTPVEPFDLTAVPDKDMNYKYAKIEGATIANGSTASGKLQIFTITLADGITELTGRNNFLITFKDGENCVLTGFVNFYLNAAQFFPTEIQTGTVIETVETPVFSVASGAVAKGTEVTISCDTEGATIYYTLDGTTPTTESAEYSIPIAIEAETTIKAIAAADGMLNSEVATATYTLLPEGEGTAGFDFTNETWIQGAFNDLEPSNTNTSGNVNDLSGKEFVMGVVAINFEKGTAKLTPSWWLSSNSNKVEGFRIYDGNTLNVYAKKDGYKLTKIEFSPSVNSNWNVSEVSVGTLTGKTWTAPAAVVSRAGDEPVVGVSFKFGGASRVSQINVTYEEAPGVLTGLKEVVVDDENAPVEYYNLQGVRIDNPANGLYIRRQGNKATKVLIK